MNDAPSGPRDVAPDGPDVSARPRPQFLTTPDGVRLAYATLGAGPAYVLVRGWISHLEKSWEDEAFRSFLEALGEHFRVVLYDGRGNGLSDRRVDQLSLESLVLDLASVIDHLALDRVTLHGATFGGPITSLYTATHADRVDRLILDGTFARGAEILDAARQTLLAQALRDFPEMAFSLLRRAANPERPESPHDGADAFEQMIEPSTAAGLYELAFTTDVRETLAGIDVPALVLHRRDSRLIPVHLGREVASVLPDARFVPLDGIAHHSWDGDRVETLHQIGAFLGVDLTLAEEEIAASGWQRFSQSDVSRFRLEQPISKGSIAVVYRATDTRLNRAVAVKVLPRSLANHPTILERFRREVRAISALSHPNICAVHDVGILEVGPCIVMELLGGQTLEREIDGAPLPLDRIADWTLQIADALRAVHEQGVIHRDITSRNIFITNNQPMVLDFGIAKLFTPASPEAAEYFTLTERGLVIGTPGYMSPEQACGEKVDIRTDLFSLGVVLFEMATGRLPFTGDTARQLIAAVVGFDPPRPGELNPALPPSFEAVILRALEKDPDMRYQTAADLQADMRRAVRELKR